MQTRQRQPGQAEKPDPKKFKTISVQEPVFGELRSLRVSLAREKGVRVTWTDFFRCLLPRLRRP